MTEQQIKLTIGSLLHDFGKLLFREHDHRNHSSSGFEKLSETGLLSDEKDILDCVRYHHGAYLKNANVGNSALCYIVYIADNISAAADRRENSEGGGFVRNIASESVFNILNGNSQKLVYPPSQLDDSGAVVYPVEPKNVAYNEQFYSAVIDRILDSLKGLSITDEYVNSLNQLLESNLTFIPSSTQTGEYRDVSLYDHLKTTAALSACILQYLEEKGRTNYKAELFDNAESFYKEKAFRLFSIDISGIQDFIYNISSKSALKGLRARSFYLEILVEHIVDELLNRLNLSRTNVMYTGGGHTYMLVPATENAAAIVSVFERELNGWFLDTFGNGLYAAFGWCDCSAEELRNKPEGSYKELFRSTSAAISGKKLHRYSAADILKLNRPTDCDHTRECRICHRTGVLVEDRDGYDVCTVCESLKQLSDMIISHDEVFFSVLKQSGANGGVVLPFGCVLTGLDSKSLTDAMKTDGYVRSYSRNKAYTGYNLVSRLWVGNYASCKEFGELADKSDGIRRLGVIRADIDSLGQALTRGFPENLSTISRTSTFSRKLSEFFKLNINYILEHGAFSLDFGVKGEIKRNAVIVYSGGDDVFVVGAWNDIVGFAVDLNNSLKKYAQGTLTISAGIGIFPAKYPISAMAEQTGLLEDCSKRYSLNDRDKNAVTLFDESGTYSWDEFIENVVGEKLRTLERFVEKGEHAKAMLYRMLELIRTAENEDRLNIARFAYLLARLAPDKDSTQEKKDSYNEFSRNMYRWIQDNTERRRLVTAIYIYAYMNRESEDNSDE